MSPGSKTRRQRAACHMAWRTDLIKHRGIEGTMTARTTEIENCRTSTETGLFGPAANWDQRCIRKNRSPVNPTIVQGNRYVAIRRKWADCRNSGSARQTRQLDHGMCVEMGMTL